MRSKTTLEQLDSVASALHARGLALPALCFVLGCRPLAFVIGQGLYLFEPLAALLGVSTWRQWAELLADPTALQHIEERLTSQSGGPVS